MTDTIFRCLLLIICMAPHVTAQTLDADALADEIALTQVPPEPGAAQEAGGAAGASLEGPRRLAVLDVGARLALLIIAVYAVAWAVKLLQRSGGRLVSTGGGHETARLQACGDLPLRGGACLHIIEVDGRAALVATTASGQVSMLLDITGPNGHAPQESAARPAAVREIEQDDDPDDSGLRLDEDWRQRRDALIRALQGARGVEA